ncbi:AI-2E family transporter [Frisingicoccus sp.]|uniref:AI-2E family transporter n=1 Tax=Frisingicoccus sp. TaxID=1918627 RepID=UPI0015B79102
MERKPVRQWMILITYIVLLIIVIVHSGYICRKLVFVGRQFIPVICAGILALVLNHPYEYVQRFYENKGKIPKKAARIFGLLTVYLGAVGVVATVFCFALPRLLSSLQQFIEKREEYMQAFEKSLAVLIGKAGIENLDISPLMEGISGYLGRLDRTMDTLLPQMARMTTGVLRSLASLGIIVVLSVYILYDKEHLKKQMKRIYRAYMPENLYEPVKSMLMTGVEVFDNFIAGQGLESLILGSLCFAGMFVLRLEYSGLVSLVAGLTAFIPILGAYIGGCVGVLLLMFISMKKALTFLAFFIVLQQVENNLIYPRVVGKRTGLPGLWVLAAVTVGGGLMGIIGMILSVPAATLAYVLLGRGVAMRERTKSTGQNWKNEIYLKSKDK